MPDLATGDDDRNDDRNDDPHDAPAEPVAAASPAEAPQTGDPVPALPRDRDELEPWFVDRYAQYWSSQGLSAIEGRMVGHLLLSDTPVSADELASAAGASRGSVSTYTRRLVDIGFVRRVRRPGDRSHYFVMDADVWGGFLDNEHAYLEKQRVLASTALALMPPSGPAHERIRNMHGYMEWLLGYYGTLRSEWTRHKAGLSDDGSSVPPA